MGQNIANGAVREISISLRVVRLGCRRWSSHLIIFPLKCLMFPNGYLEHIQLVFYVV